MGNGLRMGVSSICVNDMEPDQDRGWCLSVKRTL